MRNRTTGPKEQGVGFGREVRTPWVSDAGVNLGTGSSDQFSDMSEIERHWLYLGLKMATAKGWGGVSKRVGRAWGVGEAPTIIDRRRAVERPNDVPAGPAGDVVLCPK